MARRRQRVETRQDRYRRTHPWVRLVEWARRRCNDKSSKWWPYYGGRGITCAITAADVKLVWDRDGGGQMQRASLDRIESAKGYVPGNIRVIEWACNARMALDESFKFLYDGDLSGAGAEAA